MNSKRLLSIVVPVYCESENLERLAGALIGELEGLDCVYEILFIDDGSTDNTWEIVSRLCSGHRCINGLRLSRNFGKEAAISAGLENAQGDAVVVMDGDLQHPPSMIEEMVRIWTGEKVQIVEGVKVERGKESFWARSRAKSFYWLLSALSGLNLENASDFKLLDRKAVDAYLRMKEKNLFFRGMIAWMGFKKAQVRFSVAERAGGRSKWSLLSLLKLAVGSILSFSFIPLRIVGIMGLIFIAFAAILGLQVIYLKLTGQAVTGFATVILLLLILGGMVMISLEIIGEYIAQIYIELKSRPRYLVEESILKERR